MERKESLQRLSPFLSLLPPNLSAEPLEFFPREFLPLRGVIQLLDLELEDLELSLDVER